MAKLYAELTSDKGGRIASKSGDEWLDIDISIGNNRLARLTVRPTDEYPRGYALYDQDDEVIAWLVK